jgi:phosphoribosylanthranilate isomerase
MNRVRIKYCGFTRIEDATFAAALGVDAIGLVLTRKSKRFAGIDAARAIRTSLPPFVAAVALFMDDEPAWIEQTIAVVKPQLLQFHGSESAMECKRYGYPYLKAVAMADANAMSAAMAEHADASGWLLDSHAPGEQGGSGRAFDWTRVPKTPARPLILAGGLTCDNVGSAIRAAQPYAVDVSSGIESAPGIKDQEKMRRFAEEVKRACDKS